MLYQDIFEHYPDVVIVFRQDGRIVEANKTAVISFGLSWEELLVMNIHVLDGLSGRPLISSEAPESFFKTVACKDGKLSLLKVHVKRLPTEKEDLFLCFIRETQPPVAGLGKAFQEKIIQTCATPLFTIDPEGIITSVNDEFCLVTGYDRREVLGIPCFTLKWGSCGGKCSLLDPERKESIYKRQCTFETKEGRNLIILKNGNLLHDESGKVLGGVVSFVDITELADAKVKAEKARALAEHLASTDYLTGLLNRRAFIQRMRAEITRARREGTVISVIMTDIDNFKKINDTFGHQAGDVVLKEFADCISRLCRPYDFIGRYGGEEFIIGLPRAGYGQAVKIAERMRTEVQERLIILPECDRTIKITASFGVSVLESDLGGSLDKLISRVDEALYGAKSEGKNRVEINH